MTQPLADIGLIGLAVMGENFALNMESKGFRVAVYNRTVERVEQFIAGRASGKNFVGTRTPAELVAALQRPRKILMLIKAGPAVDAVIDELLPLLDRGDILIDGGNSLFTDTIRRTKQVEAAGMLYVGSGVSGGEEGALTGPSLMPGGSAAAWPHIKPIFQAVCARTPQGEPCCDWMGEDGAGHFVKMVHNGVEYALMASYAEGLNILAHANAGAVAGVASAESAPLRHPEHYRYEFPLPDIAELWRRGSVIGSWLLDLTAEVLTKQPDLQEFSGRVSDSGEGRWAAHAAIESTTPAPVLTAALFQRFSSRGEDYFLNRLLSAMRYQFGGHTDRPVRHAHLETAEAAEGQRG